MTLPLKFRMLALPFGGPIPRKGAPAGADLDGEWFSRHTATGLTPYSEVPVLWHHGVDPLGFLRDATLGKATGWHRDELGWRCYVQLTPGPQVELVQLLSDRVPLYGSTSARRVERDNGHITRWLVDELSLSPTPQNPYALVY